MAARPQLNPFYIEPASQQEWDGDYDWQNDDEDVEQEGLLEGSNNWQDENRQPQNRPPPARANRRSLQQQNQSPPYRFRLLLAFGFVFIMFLAVLTLFGDSQQKGASGSQELLIDPSSSSSSGGIGGSGGRFSDNEPEPDSATLDPGPTTGTSNGDISSNANDRPNGNQIPNALEPPAVPQSQDDVGSLIDGQDSGSQAPTAVGGGIINDQPGPTLIDPTGNDATGAGAGASGFGESIDDGPQQPPAKQIVILGERNSGVPWLKQQLQGMFPNVTISTTLQREGLWFQSPPTDPIRPTIIMALFRNPYDWVEQMRLHPRFMPAHLDNYGEPLAWNFFVQRQWAMQPPQTDHAPQGNETCQLGFAYNQVIACQVVDATNDRRNPIYELRQGGLPFDNILALRTAKIRHMFQEIPSLFKDSLIVDPILIRFETLNLAQDVAQIRVLQDDLDTSFIPSVPPPPDRATMTLDYVQWMTANVNWKAEARLGYMPWNTDQP